MALHCFFGAFLLCVTAGWDGSGGGNTLPPPTDVVWRAPFSEGEEAFAVERLDGAEGEVSFRYDSIRVVKTNSRGAIVVTARKRRAARKPRKAATKG